jgi:hypothetical protein
MPSPQQRRRPSRRIRRSSPRGWHCDAAIRRQAARAAGLRQATLDYRGLARALAIEGVAVERAGDKIAAADLFLRAGRSAAPKATRPAPVIGCAARCPSRLTAPSAVMQPTHCVASIRACVASIRATNDRFAAASNGLTTRCRVERHLSLVQLAQSRGAVVARQLCRGRRRGLLRYVCANTRTSRQSIVRRNSPAAVENEAPSVQ